MRNDEGRKLTDIELAELEKRIRESYGKAVDDLKGIIDDYFEKFQKRDAEMRKLIGKEVNGRVWTEEDYKQWRLAQMGRGQRFEAMRAKLAERLTHANEVALAYVNDKTPGIYTLNRNYAAYEIEAVGAGVDFTLYDESTVRRLIVERPNLMPYYPVAKAVKRKIDLDYGKKQITAAVTSGILMGTSTRKIAADLRKRIVTMSVESAIRTARTAVTAAENGGRQASYERAAEMGIELTREWLATHDARTRHAHGAADGQRVKVDEPFIVGGEELMFPGDTSRGASGWNIYNCRCCLISSVKGHERKRETYRDWLEKKKKTVENTSENDIIHIGKSLGAKARNYDISLPNREIVHLTEGTRITNIRVIGGKGKNRGIDILPILTDRYKGSKEEEWQKVKGIGYVDYDGESYKAELHWFEEPSVGRVEWKVKPDADGNWFIEDD